jgi:hypothetical protein
MYAKRVNLGMPALDTPVGFDLMVGDWVKPYGGGLNADLFFTGHIGGQESGGGSIVVTFPHPGDGIQRFTIPALQQGSALRSPHQAPTDGYEPKFTVNEDQQRNHDDSHGYLFRVRTISDERGNVKSALYGKIYGEFMQFTYYLNPVPNSLNLEFDAEQNLVTHLKSFEQVSAP